MLICIGFAFTFIKMKHKTRLCLDPGETFLKIEKKFLKLSKKK